MVHLCRGSEISNPMYFGIVEYDLNNKRDHGYGRSYRFSRSTFLLFYRHLCTLCVFFTTVNEYSTFLNIETFSPLPPSCPPVVCGVPDAIPNAILSHSGITFGHSATHHCDTGHVIRLVKSTKLLCIAVYTNELYCDKCAIHIAKVLTGLKMFIRV